MQKHVHSTRSTAGCISHRDRDVLSGIEVKDFAVISGKGLFKGSLEISTNKPPINPLACRPGEYGENLATILYKRDSSLSLRRSIVTLYIIRHQKPEHERKYFTSATLPLLLIPKPTASRRKAFGGKPLTAVNRGNVSSTCMWLNLS